MMEDILTYCTGYQTSGEEPFFSQKARLEGERVNTWEFRVSSFLSGRVKQKSAFAQTAKHFNTKMMKHRRLDSYASREETKNHCLGD